MSVFGFSTAPSESSFDGVPIVKYDARAGRFFRVDREQVDGSWANTPNDITRNFKAIFDLENIEVGWLNFNTGGAPDFRVVPIGQQMPDRPGDGHRNGIRFMVKLTKECAEDGAAIREISSVAKAFLAGMEVLYQKWQAEKDKHAGKLPVVTLKDTVPIKSGSGEKTSTNYQPIFAISGWAPRGDLTFKPKAASVQAAAAAKQAAPATGSTKVSAPAEEKELEDEFG